MDMTYDGALVMPSGSTLMNEEEMTYIEGGYTFSMSRDNVAMLIDVAAIVLTAGLSSSATVGKFAAKIGWNKLKSAVAGAIVKIGISEVAANAAVDILKTVTGFSIGAAAAWCLDKTDASGLNGYVQY